MSILINPYAIAAGLSELEAPLLTNANTLYGPALSDLDTDPDFASVVLLMGFEGSDGDTGTPGMDDESPAARGTASGGSVNAKISTTTPAFGASSLLLSGTGSITFPDSDDFHFGSGNFTVEARIRPTAQSGGTRFIACQWGSSLSWVMHVTNNHLCWNNSTTGSNNLADLVGSATLAAATWYDVAVDFDGSKYRGYVNGVLDSSFSTPRTLFNSTHPLTIGATNGGGSFRLDGNIDELRITKGVARYASDTGYSVPGFPHPRA